MKFGKRIVLILIVLLLFASTGCIPQQSKTEQFTDGLVSLLIEPLKMLQEDEGYSDDLMGELLELMDTRSHEMEMVLKLERLQGVEDMDLGMGTTTAMLSGSRINIESAYDVETGDGLMQIDILGGLFTGELSMHEDAVALDVPGFLQNLIILEYDSALDFGDKIPLSDRMTDLSNLVTSQDLTGEKFTEDLELLLNDYAAVIEGVIDPEQIIKDSQTMDVMGKSTKLEVLSLRLDARDLEEILYAVLDYAEDDDQLLDLLIDYAVPIYALQMGDEPTSSEIREMRDDIREGIRWAKDDLDNMVDYWEDLDITINIYFTYEGLLSNFIKGLPIIQGKKPVAIEIAIDDRASELDFFFKFAEKGDVRDLALNISFDDGYSDSDIQFEMLSEDREYLITANAVMNDSNTKLFANMSNTLDGKDYILQGEIEIENYDYYWEEMQTINVDIDGVTTVASDRETGEYNILVAFDDSWDDIQMDMTLTTDLTQTIKGSSYERVSDLSARVSAYGEDPVSADVSIQTSWDFSDEVVVGIPDFDDRNAIRVDDLPSLIEQLYSSLFYFGW